MDCSLPGSSVSGILQVRILEWVPCPSEGDLPDPKIEPRSPHCRQILYRFSYSGTPEFSIVNLDRKIYQVALRKIFVNNLLLFFF